MKCVRPWAWPIVSRVVTNAEAVIEAPIDSSVGADAESLVEPGKDSVESVKPLALVNGQAVTHMPLDLYIPPDALEVFLDAFEGPLDLLLYLIKRQNLNVLDIPIAEITRQYMEYVEWMKEFRLELAAEYLVMAAVLAEIKSRMLLPRPAALADEEDPRAELVRRLQQYEVIKRAAEDINALPQVGRDIFSVSPIEVELEAVVRQPPVDLRELLLALRDVMARAQLFTHHQIHREALSVRERMAHVLSLVNPQAFTEFSRLFSVEEGRRGIVVTFLAVLELIKATLIELVQNEPYGRIYVKAAQ